MDQFVLSLRSVASTLTHLSININEDLNEMVPMAEILSICPNLVSLTMRQPDLDTFKLLPVTTWPKMTTLSIHEEGGVLNPAEVKSICRRFPSLKRLEFYPCPDIRTALMIPRCCPLLKRAQIDIDNDVVGVSYVDTDTGSGEVVVTKLSVYFEFEDDEPLEESSHILRQHHGTLEGIKWNVWLERDYDDLADIQYPHLKTLALLTYGPPLIQNAPMLEELTLSATAIDDNFAVLETIPPTLKKLKLILVEIPDEFDTRALKRCLYRVSQHCQLQDLAIRFGNSYGDPDVLAAIYHFKTLQRLMLSFCWRSEPHQMEGFLDGLVNGCPRLSCLKLNSINAPSTHAINTLKGLLQLEELALSIMDMDLDDAFWDSLRTFPQLRCIRVYDKDPVNMIPIRRLAEDRPEMNIIIDDFFSAL